MSDEVAPVRNALLADLNHTLVVACERIAHLCLPSEALWRPLHGTLSSERQDAITPSHAADNQRTCAPTVFLLSLAIAQLSQPFIQLRLQLHLQSLKLTTPLQDLLNAIALRNIQDNEQQLQHRVCRLLAIEAP